MPTILFEDALDQIVAANPRYARDAYLFLRDALAQTQHRLGREAKGGPRHVSGQELLAGIREHALELYGPLALTVLEDWGVRRGEDFGEMVFTLVESGLLGKTERDSRADFVGGYNFEDAFRRPFLPKSKLPESAPAAGKAPRS